MGDRHEEPSTPSIDHSQGDRPKKRHALIRNYKDIDPVLRYYLRQWKSPMVKQLEHFTGLERIKLFYITCFLVAGYLMMGPGNHVMCNLIGVVYPTHQSVLAVRSRTKTDDTQWLMYWCSFALFTLGDFIVTTLTDVKSPYLVLKTLLLLYLALPQTYGAHNAYVYYVDPLVDWMEARFARIYAKTKSTRH